MTFAEANKKTREKIENGLRVMAMLPVPFLMKFFTRWNSCTFFCTREGLMVIHEPHKLEIRFFIEKGFESFRHWYTYPITAFTSGESGLKKLEIIKSERFRFLLAKVFVLAQ